MKRVLIGLILGIALIVLIGFVSAEENVTCSSNSDCGTPSTSYATCKNTTHICTTTTTPTCKNATTNISSCSDVKEQTCWICENGCEHGACVLTGDDDDEDENETEVDDEKSACSTINNTSKCWGRSDCIYNVSSQTCQERPTKQKKLKEAVMNYLNSTECPENCTCAGSTIKCETENGRIMTVIAGKSGNIIIQTKTINASTTVILIKNATGLYGNFSGKVKRIKYLPDEIKERVLKKLKLEDSSSYNITLQDDGSYVMNINGNYRVLWIFPKKTIVVTKINPETGEVTVIKKPFWKFRAE